MSSESTVFSHTQLSTELVMTIKKQINHASKTTKNFALVKRKAERQNPGLVEFNDIGPENGLIQP